MKKFCFLMALCVVTGSSYAFGIKGSDGSNGSPGVNGRNGEDVSVHASGEKRVFILNGTNGTNGQDADYGSNAYSCSYSEGYGNEYGADGGDGGNGGSGGDGGRGGDVVIYYTDIAKLKQITIENQGGYGAFGGRGADGGFGCQCHSSSWSLESCRTEQSCSTERVCEDTGTTRTQDGVTAPARVCHDRRTCTPVTSCTTDTYHCSDGSDGSHGRNGSDGVDGRWGQISLVRNLKKLPEQFPSGDFDVLELSTKEILLSKRIWKVKSGATELFSHDSVISDSYREFVRLATKKFKLVWKAESSVEKFKANRFKVSFDGFKVYFKDEGEDFLEYDVTEEEDTVIVTVTKAFKKEEVTKLKVDGTSGYGKNLVISIKDSAGVSTEVMNKVKLQFVHRSWLMWYVVYDKEVPAHALEITDDEIKIKVGELGILPKAIKRRKKVRFTVKVERSFGNNTTEIEEFFGPVKLY